MSDRRDSRPALVAGGNVHLLERMALTESFISEGWLQKFLYDHPGVLPVEELEPIFAPLIPLGREISTDAGPIDLMYMSPTGYVTIVETKLWRNPEARRLVVSQIIDYAKEVAAWGYTDLEKATVGKSGHGLYDSLRAHADAEDVPGEAAFVDAVSKNLRLGRFLLLLVGDGIREGVESMVDFLQQSPHLHFTMALVETQLYTVPNGDDQMLVVPQVVARTAEIERAVIRVDRQGEVTVNVNLEQTAPDAKRRRRLRSISEEDFFDALAGSTSAEGLDVAQRMIEGFRDRGLRIHWRTANVMVRLPDPSGSNRDFTLFGINKDGSIFAGFLTDQLTRAGLPSAIAIRHYTKTASLFGADLRRRPDNSPDGWGGVPLPQVARHYEAFQDMVIGTCEEIAEQRVDDDGGK